MYYKFVNFFTTHTFNDYFVQLCMNKLVLPCLRPLKLFLPCHYVLLIFVGMFIYSFSSVGRLFF